MEQLKSKSQRRLLRPLAENPKPKSALRRQRDLAQPNMQTKAGMSFRMNRSQKCTSYSRFILRFVLALLPGASLALQAPQCFAQVSSEQRLSAIPSVVKGTTAAGKRRAGANRFEPDVHPGEATRHQSKMRMPVLPWLTNGGVDVMISVCPVGLGA